MRNIVGLVAGYVLVYVLFSTVQNIKALPIAGEVNPRVSALNPKLELVVSEHSMQLTQKSHRPWFRGYHRYQHTGPTQETSKRPVPRVVSIHEFSGNPPSSMPPPPHTVILRQLKVRASQVNLILSTKR